MQEFERPVASPDSTGYPAAWLRDCQEVNDRFGAVTSARSLAGVGSIGGRSTRTGQRLHWLLAHVTQLKLPTNKGRARSRCVDDSVNERRHPARTCKRC